MNYLKHIKFFSSSQYGFRKGCSTDTALFSHITDITESIEKNKITVGLYLDLAKAFDTVSHNKLLGKMREIGVEGPLYEWFDTDLRARKHKVKIDEIYSTELLAGFGAPRAVF